jgi:uracil-DNA glycosylase family 4
VGEQPGDKEDIEGRPFVGPAGQLLDRALAEAGIDRQLVYVTNVVKHFKWTARGKRRIHQKPNAEEITACRPWLAAELVQVDPSRRQVLAEGVHGRVAFRVADADVRRVRSGRGCAHSTDCRRAAGLGGSAAG